MVVQEVYGGWMKRKSKENWIFYYVLLQEEGSRTRYLKLGISSRGVQRFKDADYRKYSCIKPLYMIECTDPNEIKDLEDLNRVILRNTKGLSFVDKDRFKYFLLPKELPRCFTFGQTEMIKI